MTAELFCCFAENRFIAMEGTMADTTNWDQENRWWEQNFVDRPYAAGRKYDEFRPAYRYGYESGRHHMGRTWSDVEQDLRTGWDKFEGKGPGGAAWENIKDAVKDAWHRVTGQHGVDTEKMSQSEVDRLSQGGRPR
jgi:hypothetical protein